MKNFVQNGDIVTVTAPANVASGDLVIVGGLIGIAATDALSGAPVEIKLTGAYELPKTSAQAWATEGLAIYWDADPGEATTVATGNVFIGVNIAVAGNPSATGIVRLGAIGVPSGAQITAEITAAVGG